MVSVYVHIPFCRSRCHYCGFATWPGLEGLMRPYGKALLNELDSLSPWLALQGVDTLYVGGGTPTLMPENWLAELVSRSRLDSDAEITIEANPGGLNRESLSMLRQAGFNRLSLGMQSAHGDELGLLGRSHDLESVGLSMERARAAGFENLSLDLIYGLPVQSVERWQRTVSVALDLGPDHLSLYALSVEPGTVLATQIARGHLPLPDTDKTAEMYEIACALLREAGYLHYEISNWSLPGHESQHNLAYWRNLAYLGVGASAWGHWPVGGRSWRFRNIRYPRPYIGAVDRTPAPVYHLPVSLACAEQEFIPRSWAMAETMFMGLRLVSEGVSRKSFRARFGIDPVECYRTQLTELKEQGWVRWDTGAIRLSESGLFVSNKILLAFLPESRADQQS